uniref:Uncharacterized protein n=1 Tax=Solanum tuberosum TaxID=4113 RepID=M1DZ36_SOLTU
MNKRFDAFEARLVELRFARLTAIIWSISRAASKGRIALAKLRSYGGTLGSMGICLFALASLVYFLCLAISALFSYFLSSRAPMCLGGSFFPATFGSSHFFKDFKDKLDSNSNRRKRVFLSVESLSQASWRGSCPVRLIR